MDEQYKLTPASGNRKTGPIAVSMTGRSSCPDGCPLKDDGGCFGEQWPMMLHWDKLDSVMPGKVKSGLRSLISGLKALPIGKLWRHNQVGDLPGAGDQIDAGSLGMICKAADKRQLRGWTYTHKPVLPEDVKTPGLDPEVTARSNGEVLQAVQEVSAGLVVNLSANNPAHLDRMREVHPGLDFAVLISDDASKVTRTPDGHKIVWCPAQWNDPLTCEGCGNGRPLCQRKGRDYAVGFKAHGNRARKVREEVINGGG
jgi:hypothetical protein